MAEARKYDGEARAEIEGRAAELAEKILRRQLERQPDLETRYGRVVMEICREDVNYHLAYLSEAVSLESLSLLEDYMSWVKPLFFLPGPPRRGYARQSRVHA